MMDIIREQILSDEFNPSSIKTKEDLSNLFHLRHDIIHEFFCQSFNIPFGERPIHETFTKEELFPYHTQIGRQTPDIVIRSDMSVKIIELTISNSDLSVDRKSSKYSLLVRTLERNGIKVDFQIACIPTTSNINTDIEICERFSLDIQQYRLVKQMMMKVDDSIRLVMLTPSGKKLMSDLRDLSLDDHRLSISNEDIIDYYNNSECKTFHSESDLREILEEEYDHDLNQDDEILIDKLVDHAINIEPLLFQNEQFDENDFWKFHKDHSNTSLIRPIFPLPYLLSTPTDSAIRSTEYDNQAIRALKDSMSNSGDPILEAISKLEPKDPDDESIGKVKLSTTMKFNISIHGPGRKRYVKAGSIPHIESQRKHSLYWLDPTTDVSKIHNFTKHISSRMLFASPDELDCPAFNLARTYQSIFREININSLRSELNKNFIIKPTGVAGVYVIIHKGPKLRVNMTSSLIWFKVIGYTQYFPSVNEYEYSEFFQKVYHTRDDILWHSEWLSTDSHRLTHYIRCYDKITMAYMSYCSASKQEINRHFEDDDSDVLGLITTIFLEDKRSTSKMLQDVRYVVMMTLSIKQYWKTLMDKFKEPIRSPLQLYLLKKIVHLVSNSNNFRRQTIMQSSFPDRKSEMGTSKEFQTESGAFIQCPRILSSGQTLITFRQALHEMYFCMLFNKDQDDITHASFQILQKIIEGENNLEKIRHTGLHMGYMPGVDEIDFLSTSGFKNCFSRKVVVTASKLQSISTHCSRPYGQSHYESAFSRGINKTIDEFATFKSSATIENKIYSHDLDDKKVFQLNRRRRCLEGVMSLVDDGLMDTFDVFNKYSLTELGFHVFKKNQIGGVREILILPIEKRICINMIESHARSICSHDDREMLTHGRSKFSKFSDIQSTIQTVPGRNFTLHYNYDKTKWGPSFMPIQFMYMYLPFKKFYPKLFRAIVATLMCHSNKQCYYPDALMKAWINDKDMLYEHRGKTKSLQPHKEEFLSTRKVCFTNESNMGQGILHYTSSHYHLCVLSLRDEIFRRLCKRKGLNPGVWSDLVSSDDSYTCHSIPIEKRENGMEVIRSMLQAQEISERTMNVWTSRSKSSISSLIGEFNSCFMSFHSAFPATLKFALAAVQPVCTDSFTTMVDECYNSSRQLFENAGSLELYMMSQKLNKKFCETIYRSNTGDNDPRYLFPHTRSEMPYQFGIYPLDFPELMLQFGPECHNMRILVNNPSENILKYFRSIHTIIDDEMLEDVADFDSPKSFISGVRPINAITRVNKRLLRMRKQSDVNPHILKEEILKDPLIILRRAANIKEVKFKTQLKLFQRSAVNAMKMTDGALYYGRVSATATARAFRLMGQSEENLFTYKECLAKILEFDSPFDMRISYPRIDEYRKSLEIAKNNMVFVKRNLMEPMKLLTINLSDTTERLTNPLYEILDHFWNGKYQELESFTFMRDLSIIQRKLPYIETSIEETLEHINGDDSQKISKLCLLLMRLLSMKNHTLKGFMFGYNSKITSETTAVLKGYNSYSTLTSEGSGLERYYIKKMPIFEKTMYVYNMFMLFLISKNKEGLKWVKSQIHLDDITDLCTGFKIPFSTKKRFLFMLIYYDQIDDVRKWTRKTGTILRRWIKRQDKIKGKWVGDYTFVCQKGNLKCMVRGGDRRGRITMSNTDDLTEVHHMLLDVMSTLRISFDEAKRYFGIGDFDVQKKGLRVERRSGIAIEFRNLPDMVIDFSEVKFEEAFISLVNQDGQKVLDVNKGLFNVRLHPFIEEIEHLSVFDVNVKLIRRLELFSPEFRLAKFSNQYLVESLDDIDVSLENKPKELSIEDLTESQDFEVEIDYDLDFMDDIMTHYGSDFFKEEIKIEDDPLDYFIDTFTDNMPDFKIAEKFSSTAGIFKRVQLAKALVISYLMLGRQHQINARPCTAVPSPCPC
jgi:hypothetical protein